jgi:hypothetical protein
VIWFQLGLYCTHFSFLNREKVSIVDLVWKASLQVRTTALFCSYIPFHIAIKSHFNQIIPATLFIVCVSFKTRSPSHRLISRWCHRMSLWWNPEFCGKYRWIETMDYGSPITMQKFVPFAERVDIFST